MVPAIDTIFSMAVSTGITNIVIGMPHRGRLNLLMGLLRFPPRDFFWKVQGNSEIPEGVEGIGDVISHIGTSPFRFP
jgi:probable 2-oxoglutarate dehydrogenase E1 component DHKTD1